MVPVSLNTQLQRLLLPLVLLEVQDHVRNTRIPINLNLGLALIANEIAPLHASQSKLNIKILITNAMALVPMYPDRLELKLAI